MRKPFVFIFAVATLLAGCSRAVAPYELQPKFSVNVAHVNPEWPKEREHLSPTESEVLDRYGRPDYMHLIWSEHNEVTMEADLQRIRRVQGLKPPKIGWLYLEEDREVVFERDKRDNMPTYRLKDVDDRIRIICEFGDPPEIDYITGSTVRKDRWLYFREGMIITWEGDRMVDRDETSLPPQPGYLGY